MREILGRYGARAGSLVHLPWGISPLRRTDAPLPSFEHGVRLGYLGHAGTIKGFGVLREAVRRLDPDTPLTVDVYNSELARQAKGGVEDAPRLRFHENRDPWSIGDVYRDLHAVVVPSIWHENSPLVVLEALAGGRPVIASDVRGTSEHVVDGQNGILFPPGDAGALADILRRVAAQPARIRDLAARCRYDCDVDTYARTVVKRLAGSTP
jgi:glycosyltransferase involved in cell wall biosynthesis